MIKVYDIWNNTMPGAPNFTYGEVLKSETALRAGLDNFPGENQLKALEYTMKTVLQPVRDRFGPIRITSGYTTAQVAVHIPRSTTSNHIRGEAIDFEPIALNKASLLEMGLWIIDNLSFRELIFEYLPTGWIHVAAREGDNAKQIKIKDAGHDYKVVRRQYAEWYFGKGGNHGG